MNSTIPPIVATLARAALNFGAGFLVAKGIVSADQAPELVAALMGLVAVGWGVKTHRDTVAKLNAAGGPPY